MDEHAFLAALRGYWNDQVWQAPVNDGWQFIWDDDEKGFKPTDKWVRIGIRCEGGLRRGAGRRREETRGLVSIEVYNPRADGSGPGERFSSALAAAWRAFRHERIQLSAPSVVGPTTDGAFNRHLITLGWRGDQRLAA